MRTIRPATKADLPEMMQIFAEARQFMAQTGNPTQWPPTYPSAEILRADLAAGRSYVCEEDGAMVATFCFGIFDDPTYAEIYYGAWLRDAPYGVIHRIATRAHGGAASGRAVRRPRSSAYRPADRSSSPHGRSATRSCPCRDRD